MRVRAFAKINLSLRVVGTRPDGYHELRTVFQSIALHDTIAIRRRRGALTLTCDDPACPTDRANLIWRAADRLWRAAGKRGSARDLAIHVTKRIPMQAGLGGGSSDCAAALRALGRLWRVPVERQRDIGRALGADVPYFFEGGTVLGLERGDLLFPLVDAPAVWVLLVIPEVGVSTKEAFAWYDEAIARSSRRAPAAVRGRSMRRNAGREPTNDLECVVAGRRPEIARLIRALRGAGAAGAAMSGSGAAVFGLFARRNAALRAARGLAGRGRRIIVSKTLDRRAYQRLAAT